MAANHIKLIENCFSKLCELISAIKNGEDGAKLQKISCLFELMQQMFAAKEVGVLTEKIDSAETELDKYEENILKKIMSAPFLQSDKMQFMLYINKISKIPDVIKGNVKKVCKKT